MKTLLRIDTSLRLKDSCSRSLGDYFVQEWQRINPAGQVMVRDVTENFIPHLDQQTLNGFYDDTVCTELLSLSDHLIAELCKCDEILITAPMYNFGIPSSLKAYFDLVVRTGKTVVYDKDHRGLVRNKRAYLITAMGDGKDEGVPHNLVEMHLQKVLNYIGISDLFYFAIEGTANKMHSMNTGQQKEKIKNCLRP